MLKLRRIKITKSQLPTLRSFTAYASVFTVFVSALGLSYQYPVGGNMRSLFASDVSASQHEASVDDATALHIAGNIALRADLPIAANITNRSTSLFVQSVISQDRAAVVAKPLIGNVSADDRTVINHTVKEGDTPQSIADQYDVDVQTIKWANNLNTNVLEVGANIVAPPVDGVLYTTKDGDTVESIADKYKADAQYVIAYNDLELSGVKSGQQIMLPNAELPVEERPEYVAPVQETLASVATIASAPTLTSALKSAPSASPLVNGFTPIAKTAAGNAYAFGNCTSWAYERRVQLGHPVGSYWGNGATWDSSARAAGYIVDKNPTVGAVMQMPAFVDSYTGVYGHVGIVESVNADGSIYISEMNYAGNFNVVTYRTVPAAQAALYNYIH